MITASRSSPARAGTLPLLLLAVCSLLTPACEVVDPEQDLAGYPDKCQVREHCADGFVCDGGRCSIPAGEACREGFVSETCEGRSKGVCAGVRKPCVNGVYALTCEQADFGPDFEPDETRCDGLDNDCDGTVDRGPCELTLGVCAGKMHACSGGLVERQCGQSTYGPSYQQAETRCDGLDNDCDGTVDASRPAALAISVPVLSAGTPGDGTTPSTSSEPRVVPFGTGFLSLVLSTTSANHPYQPPPAQTPPPTFRSYLGYQLLNAELVPVGPLVFLYDGDSSLSELQALPFDGGVFLLWARSRRVEYNGQTSYVSEAQLARLDVGTGANGVSVGIAPRLPPDAYTAYMLRGAVSNDSQHLLLTWNGGGMSGRLYSRDLAPLSEVLPLSRPHPTDAPNSYVIRADVTAHGSTGFALGWAISTPPPMPPPGQIYPTMPFQLRFQRLDGALQPAGDVVALEGETASVQDLRVLGSKLSEENLFAAWQVTYPYVEGKPTPAPSFRYARPLAADKSVSGKVENQYGWSRLLLARDATDDVLVAYWSLQGTSGVTAKLRRIATGKPDVDRALPVPPYNYLQGLSLLPHREPELRTVAYALPQFPPQAFSYCRF